MKSLPLAAIRGLTWPPDSTTTLFDDVDFAVEAGERVALRGASGVGKSTLLRCFVGLEPRRSGSIEWRGEVVEPGEMPEFRRRVHYVHQQPVAVASSVEQNLEFARELASTADGVAPLTADEQQKLLAQLNLQSRVDGGRPFDELSVGEQQRVSLVRSLTGRPAVLLLDEPTAALDRSSANAVRELVDNYVADKPEERACVWASHEHGFVEDIATRTVDVGALASEG